MAKMRAAPLVKRSFRCSLCKRCFDKIENVTCHVTRNAKSSNSGASIEDVRKQRPDPLSVVAKSELKPDLLLLSSNRENKLLFSQ